MIHEIKKKYFILKKLQNRGIKTERTNKTILPLQFCINGLSIMICHLGQVVSKVCSYKPVFFAFSYQRRPENDRLSFILGLINESRNIPKCALFYCTVAVQFFTLT